MAGLPIDPVELAASPSSDPSADRSDARGVVCACTRAFAADEPGVRGEFGVEGVDIVGSGRGARRWAGGEREVSDVSDVRGVEIAPEVSGGQETPSAASRMRQGMPMLVLVLVLVRVLGSGNAARGPASSHRRIGVGCWGNVGRSHDGRPDARMQIGDD